MLDRPDARMILSEVQAELKEGIPPGFQQKVAANAVALALREQALGEAAQAAERRRLIKLLAAEESLEALNAKLAKKMREGSFDRADPALAEHLILTTLEKMAVDQPSYPALLTLRTRIGGRDG